MSLKDKIDQDLMNAMRAKNQDELRALRAIKSMILLAETEKGAPSKLNEEAEMKLLSKAVKQRKESSELFREQGRDDLLTKENAEIEIIEKYLPAQLSDQELLSALKILVGENNASGMQDMGKIMGLATKIFAGKADGKRISELVKSILT